MCFSVSFVYLCIIKIIESSVGKKIKNRIKKLKVSKEDSTTTNKINIKEENKKTVGFFENATNRDKNKNTKQKIDRIFLENKKPKTTTKNCRNTTKQMTN